MCFRTKPLKFTSILVFFLLIVLLQVSPTLVASQNSVTIETLRVDIWPEYDKPSVLVIYHIMLAADTNLPAEMSIRIPATVGEPHAVAMKDPNGLYNLNYNLVNKGEWEEIRFSAPVPEIRIEYYDPGLNKSGDTRYFDFEYAGDYTVNNLSLMVQQPASAKNMIFKPDMGSGVLAEDGLTYFTYMVGKVNSGTSFSLSLSYEKGDDSLTSTGQFQPVQPSSPVNESPAGRINLGQALPWALGALGLLLIASGLFYYFGPRREKLKVPRRRHSTTNSLEPDNSTVVFCHQCGKRAAPGDIFCRACGTKLR